MRLFMLLVLLLSVGAQPAFAAPSDPIPYTWQEAIKPGKAEKLAKAYLVASKKQPQSLLLREKAAVLLLLAWKLEAQDLKKRHILAKAIISVGKDMIRLAPDKPHGHHWYGVGVETLGLSRGILNSLKLVPEGKRALEKSIEIDPSYLYGSAQLQLGRALLLLPGFPLSIGDAERALELTREGVRRGPNFTMGYLYLADLYWMLGRPADALREARKIPTLKPTNEYEHIVYAESVKKAKELEERINSGDKRRPYYDWIWMELEPGLVD